jgi:putative toxin-antitoxin system antitoxin component (TIGR02293 family)
VNAKRIWAYPKKRLGSKSSAHTAKVESIYSMAAEILGSHDAAVAWLNTESMGLQFSKPIDLISSTPGLQMVETLLQRLKFGVYT